MGDKVKKVDLARNILEKYIELGVKNKKGYSKRFIATQLHNEYPSEFKNVEHARKAIREVTNAMGAKQRSSIHEDLSARFALISEQIEELDYKPFIVPTAYKKTLWVADLHSKFCDRKALSLAIEYALKKKCDSVIINGDFMDFYNCSKFDKTPSVKSQFESEREWGHDILKLLQDEFGYVVLKEGNHDQRREKLIQKMAAELPEFEGIFGYEDYLFFDNCHVNFVKDYNHIIYGKLNGIHGHEYQGGGGIHVAYNRLNKTMVNTISAHSHKGQSTIKTNMNNEIIGSWALGCMCNLHPRYAPKNDWTQGFAITEKDSNGEFEVNNKIFKGNYKIVSI